MSTKVSQSGRVTSFVLWVVFACLVLKVGFRLAGRDDIGVVFAQQPPARPAHTIFLTEIVTPTDGSPVGHRKLVTAVRSDGAEMMGEVFPTNMRSARELHLPSDRTHTIVFDLSGVKTSTPLNQTMWRNRRRPDPSRNCVADFKGAPLYTRPVEFLRHEDVGGYRTAVLRLGNITAWHAISIDCALLKQRAEFPDSIEEKILESVRLGEPDAKYFDIPAGAQESSPSAVRSRFFGQASVRPQDLKDDERYRELNRTK